jgi:hypothetical protein
MIKMRQLLIFLISLLLAANAFAQFAEQAKIISVAGDVQVLDSYSGIWKKAEKSMLLRVNDQVKTGADGTAEISLGTDDKDIFKLDPNTTVKISLIEERLKVVDLPVGKVFGYVSDLNRGSNFEVRTPTATAGARGTAWSVWTDGFNNQFSTFERNIYVKSFDAKGRLIKQVTLGEGFKVEVRGHQSPAQFFKIPESEFNRFKSWQSDFTNRIPYFKGLSSGPAIKTPDDFRQQQQEMMDNFKNRYRYDQGGSHNYENRYQGGGWPWQ